METKLEQHIREQTEQEAHTREFLTKERNPEEVERLLKPIDADEISIDEIDFDFPMKPFTVEDEG